MRYRPLAKLFHSAEVAGPEVYGRFVVDDEGRVYVATPAHLPGPDLHEAESSLEGYDAGANQERQVG